MKKILIGMTLLVSACSQPATEQTGEQTNANPATTKKAAFSGPCAVVYHADSIQFARFTEGMSDEEIATIIDDGTAYLAETRNALEEKGIKVFDTVSHKFSFRMEEGTYYDFEVKDPSKDAWGVLLFNGKTAPFHVFREDVETKFDSLMEKK